MKIVVAMCDVNRGMGKDNALPWPYLSADNEYYRNLVVPKEPGQKTANIKGRLTWMLTDEKESDVQGVLNIILTSQSKEAMTSSKVHYTCRSLEEAVQYAAKCEIEEDDMWVMGGRNVFKAAIEHPACSHVYLTRIFAEFDCDVHFPAFEHLYKLMEDPECHNEAGICYQFEVYERLKEKTMREK